MRPPSRHNRRDGIGAEWEARQSSTLAGAEKYSRFVHMMRLALPAFALTITLIVVFYSVLLPSDRSSALRFFDLDAFEGELSMVNAHFAGLDIEDRYFEVIAAKAVRSEMDEKTIFLNKIDATVTKDKKMLMHFNAKQGTLRSRDSQLVIGPSVTISFPEGYQMVTAHTFADLNLGVIEGDKPIEGTGPVGIVRADSFRILNKDRIIRLEGNVRMSLDVSKLHETPAPESSEESNES